MPTAAGMPAAAAPAAQAPSDDKKIIFVYRDAADDSMEERRARLAKYAGAAAVAASS
jgi:hypothetical protein